MKLHSIIDHFHQVLQEPLPGSSAHEIMAPYKRPDAIKLEGSDLKPKPSAVLVLLYQKLEVPHIVLMLRNAYEGVHSRQVSFPGGKKEVSDPNLLHTALREAEEEVGVHRNGIEVLGPLTEVYIPPSNFLVSPFLAFSETTPLFQPDPEEVAEIIEVPLLQLLDEKRVKEKMIPVMNGKMEIKAPYFDLNGHVVWGATAIMLSELKVLLQQFQ